jgi:hypothetical protein
MTWRGTLYHSGDAPPAIEWALPIVPAVSPRNVQQAGVRARWRSKSAVDEPAWDASNLRSRDAPIPNDVPVSRDLPSSSATGAQVVPRHRGQETRCVTPGCAVRALLGSVQRASGSVVVHSRSALPVFDIERSAFAAAETAFVLDTSAAQTVPNSIRHIEHSSCAVRDIPDAVGGVRLLVSRHSRNHARKAPSFAFRADGPRGEFNAHLN